MATITPVAASATGTAVTFAAASGGGDSLVANNNRVALVVRNASGGSITVTLAGSVLCSQGSTHNKVITCAVGDTEILIPSNTVAADTGLVAITYSSATSVTVAAVIV
jgi:hypothetical protein